MYFDKTNKFISSWTHTYTQDKLKNMFKQILKNVLIPVQLRNDIYFGALIFEIINVF